ncbi:MAG TPA: hypothetical protein VNN77_09890 [candidate division Zixibacteria bacterium]|nr:hypothetical protein [candidate division Zixibacteria bacterium]
MRRVVRFASLAAVLLGGSLSVFADDYRPYWRLERRDAWREEWREWHEERRRLVGRWYLEGRRDKPCVIFMTRDGLQARNERGDVSLLAMNGPNLVHAVDWEGGLRGRVRGNRIVWANGTTWRRYPGR